MLVLIVRFHTLLSGTDINYEVFSKSQINLYFHKITT